MSLYAQIDLQDGQSGGFGAAEAETGAAAARRRTFMALLIILTCLCAGTALAFKSAAPPQAMPSGLIAVNSDEDALYQTIEAEAVPGLKLARMQDFLVQYPNSARRTELSANISALSAAEQNAWAQLSERLYDLRATPAAKQAAIDAYSAQWSRLFRQERIDAIIGSENAKTAETSALALTFKTETSRFANVSPAGGLVGAPNYGRQAMYQARLASVRTPAVQNTQRITPLAVRTAREPEYPKRARRRGVEAVVTLAMDIDERGRVVDTYVLEVSAENYAKDFIRAAERAAQRSRFHPKTVNGEAAPQAGYVRTYTFRL